MKRCISVIILLSLALPFAMTGQPGGKGVSAVVKKQDLQWGNQVTDVALGVGSIPLGVAAVTPTDVYPIDTVALAVEFATPSDVMLPLSGTIYNSAVFPILDKHVIPQNYDFILVYTADSVGGWIHSGYRFVCPAKNTGWPNDVDDKFARTKTTLGVEAWQRLRAAPHLNSINFWANYPGDVIYPPNGMLGDGEFTVAHEVGHQWSVFFSRPTSQFYADWDAHPDTPWTPKYPLGWYINPDAAHWSYVFPAAGMMYSSPTGTFNAIDLYAMGLLPYEQARGYTYAITPPPGYPSLNSFTLDTMITALANADPYGWEACCPHEFLRGDGKRIPATDSTVEHLQSLIVVLTTRGRQLTADEKDRIGRLARNIPKVWDGATWHLSDMQVRLELKPPIPHPSVSQVEFAATRLVSTKDTLVFVRNELASALHLDSVFLSHGAPFSLGSPQKMSLRYMDSVGIPVSFGPMSLGDFSDTLYIRTNGLPSLLAIPLSGASPIPVPTLWPASFDPDTAAIGDSSVSEVVMRNPTINDLTVFSVHSQTPSFVLSDTSVGTVRALDTMAFKVSFKPSFFGAFTDTLTINTNAGLIQYPLRGNCPPPDLFTSVAFLDFGEVGVDTAKSLQFTIMNRSINVLRVDSVVIRGHLFGLATMALPTLVRKADTIVTSVTFDPDSANVVTDTLFIYSNASESPKLITLNGEGVKITTATGPADALPTQWVLYECYPNPFNPSTTIRYGLPSRSHVTLTVFNTLGQQVAVLQNGEQQAGYHEVRFDASGLASGVYLYRLTAGSYVETRRLLLLR